LIGVKPSRKREADRKRSEHAARTAYILCYSSCRVLTLFCQSLQSRSAPEAPTLLEDFTQISLIPLKSKQKLQTKKLKRKKPNKPSKHNRKNRERKDSVLLGSGEHSPYRN
jgi:hypothetical protein